MIIVLERGATDAHVEEVRQLLAERGLDVRVLAAGGKPAIHVLGGDTRRARKLLKHERVEALVPTSGPRVRREGRRFWPYHFIRWSALSVALVGALVLMAGQLPPGIGGAVDPRVPPADLDQPWYLRFSMGFVGLFPDAMAWVGWLLLALLALVFFCLPLLDRSRPDARGVRALIGLAGVVLVLAWLYAGFSGGHA